jgi:hypothetical protein
VAKFKQRYSQVFWIEQMDLQPVEQMPIPISCGGDTAHVMVIPKVDGEDRVMAIVESPKSGTLVAMLLDDQWTALQIRTIAQSNPRRAQADGDSGED